MDLLAKDTIAEICKYLSLVELIRFSRVSKHLIKICRFLISNKTKDLEYEISIIDSIRLNDYVYLFNNLIDHVFELSCESDSYFLVQISTSSKFLLELPFKYDPVIETIKKEVWLRIKLENFDQLFPLLKVFKDHNVEIISNETAHLIIENISKPDQYSLI